MRSQSILFVAGAVSAQVGLVLFKAWLRADDERVSAQKRLERADEFKAIFGIEAPSHPSRATTSQMRRVLETLGELHEAPTLDTKALSTAGYLASLFTPLDWRTTDKVFFGPRIEEKREHSRREIDRMMQEARDELQGRYSPQFHA